MWRRAAWMGAAVSAVAWSTYASMETHDRRRVRALVEAGGRALTLVGVVGLITVDYKCLQFKSSLSSILSQKEVESNKRIKYAEQALLEADATAKAAEMRLAELSRISTRAKNSNREAAESEAKATMRIAAEVAEALVKARKDAEHSAASQHTQQILDAHQRAANRLLWLARTNKGVYIKLAQHLAQLDYLVPDEYTRTLRVCLDNAPQSSYEDVCHVITDELGAPPNSLFHSFERMPIASASLAQVHVAYLPDSRGQRGLKCAVKVQHRGLRETAAGDVEAVSAVVKLVSRAFPDMPLWWVADEIAPNLPIELDFCQEANHAERCRQLYANDERVRVPHVLPHLSSKRVLTMSFEDGCSITDVEAIRGMHLSTQAVAELLAETFNRQMYQAGFVHCDPHPANVLVRALPRKFGSSAWLPDRLRGRRQPQLVLLDHGLYRDLDTHFTKEYCILWRALVLGDVQTIRRQCQLLGAGDMYPLLAAMLTARPWNKILERSGADPAAPEGADSEEERMKLKQYATHYAIDIGAMLNKVPRQMLLLFKANDCLRHVERRLGAHANSLESTARHTAQALVGHAFKTRSLLAIARAVCELWLLEAALFSWRVHRAVKKFWVF